MMRLVGKVGTIAAALMLLGGASYGSPAAAAPHSPVLTWRFEGWLGKSGLYVQTTPQSLLVLRVARGSPAAVAGIAPPASPSPKGAKAPEPQVLRILTINGRPVHDLPMRAVYAAFNPPSGAERATVLLGRRGPADVDEIVEGPIVVDLQRPLSASAFDLAGRQEWARALAVTRGAREVRSAVVARMLFEAQRRGAQGDLQGARDLLALVPRDDPAHARSVELARQYEQVTREARRPRAR